jgi:ADP-heptose:LPS heptosyltransferase
MHLAEIVKPNPIDLPVGELVICEDVNAGEMLSRGWCNVKEPDYRCSPLPIYRNGDYDGKKILFERPGGFGDLLFLTPTIHAIKEKWPTCEISVACFDRFKSILFENPDVDGFVQYPISVENWLGFDAHCWLENSIEENPRAREIHAVDLIAERANVELKDKRMRYFVTEVERIEAEKEFPRKDGLHRVGVQVSASGSCRTPPRIGEVSNQLYNKGYEVFLLGRPGDFDSNEPERVINLMKKNKTFRQSCAVLQTCDVVVAPDSALVHVAGALDIPCIGLYGPFPWQLRTAYAKNTFALQGHCVVSPCFHHARPGTGMFPEHGPCYKTKKCEALETITVDRILREVEKRIQTRKLIAA